MTSPIDFILGIAAALAALVLILLFNPRPPPNP